MTDYREELAAAIAEKYLELDALSKESGAYGAIRLDWARYGEDGLDDMLIAFMEGLDDFDKSMSGAMKDEDYVRTALENIMDERGMTDEQRTSFLKTMQTYASQSGMDSLRDALDGHKENVMRALVQMSEAAPAEKGKANTQAAMDEICQSARRRQREERREMLQNLTGDKADELLRCYAAYCVLRDGAGENRLGGNCLRLIGTTVRAGEKQSGALEGERSGKITGEQAAEALRAIAEVLLIAFALFISCSAGAYAAINVVQLAGMLIGFTGALGGVGLAVGILCALPTGIVVTRDMIRLCAKAGVWLEQHALEPGAQKAAQLFDDCGKWMSETIAPAAQKTWQDVCAALSGVRPQAEAAWQNACGAAQNAFNCVRPHVEQAAAGAWNWMEHSAYELGGALDKLFSAFHMDPNGET